MWVIGGGRFRQVQDAVLYTKLTVHASGNNIEFRFGHDEALRFKDALMGLVLAPTAATAAVPAQPDAMDQLRKLAELRDAGVLSPDEFDRKKAELLDRI